MVPELLSRRQKIENLISRTGRACGDDDELLSHWAKYICVQISGYLEKSLPIVFGSCCRRTADNIVSKFAQRALERIRNPNATVFIDVAKAFKPEWGDKLTKYLDEDGRGDAINSIISNRHKIAHGGNSNVTMAAVKSYFKRCSEVLEFIENDFSRRTA